MFDEWGNNVNEVRPGFPVQVIGWKDDNIPDAGDKVYSVDSEREAKQFVTINRHREREQMAVEDHQEAMSKSSCTRCIRDQLITNRAYSLERLEQHQKEHHEQLVARRAAGIRRKLRNKGPREKMIKDDPNAERTIHVILKCDVMGSLEVLQSVIDSYPSEKEEVKVDIITSGVGHVTEGDLELAKCFPNTFIYSFNLRNKEAIIKKAKEEDVVVKEFNVIYHLVDDLKKEINEKLPLLDKEDVVGEATVLQEFLINERNKKVFVN